MIGILQTSPFALVFVMLLLLRQPPVRAAVSGVFLTAVIWVLIPTISFDLSVATNIGVDTLILFASTAAVIAPGLAFVILVERLGVNQAVAQWVNNLGWSKTQQIIFITLGLAPMLEAMTGFGVSLIATVPLLLALFPRQIAMRVALCGMVIMPWGTLGLATVVGSALADIPPSMLGQGSTVISAGVFLMSSAVALWLAGERHVIGWFQLLVAWGIFLLMLFGANTWLGPEVAGVLSGLVVLLVGMFMSRKRGEPIAFPEAAWPYALLLFTIVFIKSVLLITPLNDQFMLTGSDVRWNPLSSPGIALSLVVVFIAVTQVKRAAANGLPSEWLSRAIKPLSTIFFFLLLSQAMLKGGFLSSLQKALGELPEVVLGPVSASLAGLSGYMTGSNVGGNAIFMPTLATVQVGENGTLWLAAIQNSGAGHGAMGSLSILALVSGLVKITQSEEQSLVRFGVLLVVANTTLIAAVGTTLLFMDYAL